MEKNTLDMRAQENAASIEQEAGRVLASHRKSTGAKIRIVVVAAFIRKSPMRRR